MPIAFAGELAALATSLCFSIAPTYFTLAAQQLGGLIVNRYRLAVSVLLLLISHWVFFGTPLPLNAGPERWFWFSVSGLIGLVLGDAALFQAFVLIGTRLSMLLFATNPILAAAMAWLFLGERLGALEAAGILVTLAGVALVVTEKQAANEEKSRRREYGLGLTFGFLAAAGQAAGLITAKLGLAGDYPTLSGQVIRLLTAMLILWAWTIARGQGRSTVAALRSQPFAVRHATLGAFFGPFIGIWFSLVAIQYTEVGVASTLMSLPPIFLLPIGRFVFKETISKRAVTGTIIALAGVAALFLV
jgi:drug/metabolite transporter (DMT)-like permease